MARTVSGAQFPSDPANQPNQYPTSLFGVGLPQGTGAAGGPTQYTPGEDAGDATVTVSDPVANDRAVQGDLSGGDDWTTYNTAYGGREPFSGVDLSGGTGAGKGSVRGPGHPNSMNQDGEPR